MSFYSLVNNPNIQLAFWVLTLLSFSVIVFHLFNFYKFYKLNKQVERILNVRQYERNQEMGDQIKREKVDELSSFRLVKRGRHFIKVFEIPESDVEIIRLDDYK